MKGLSTVELTIDGKRLTAQAGETVLDCALRHHIDIPHLCAHENLPPFGACRMCVVEIEGMRGFPTSCTTPVAEGMVVQTNTEALRKLRRNILAMIMLEHPSACLVCGKRDLCEEYRPKAEKAGRTTGCHTCNNKEGCEVRRLSEELELHELPVAPQYHERPVERSNPFMDRDLNLCILCGRCVRICKHKHGMAVIDFIDRSSQARIGEAFEHSLQEAGCRFCGSCVDVCPTGALADRYAKWHGKPDAFTATTCIFCDEACALEVGSSEGQSVTARAIDGDTPLCVLGRFGIPEFLNEGDRLRTPLKRVGEVLREVEWMEALDCVAEQLKPYSGKRFAFVCDTTSTLEDRHVFKIFTEQVMQSPHYIECDADARGVSSVMLPEGVEAVYCTGNFVDPEGLENLSCIIVQDCYPSAVSERADIVLPAAVFTEVDGTIQDCGGFKRPLFKATDAPGQARPEWRILCDVAHAMGASVPAYDSVEAIAETAGINNRQLRVEMEHTPVAAQNPALRRLYFRGHRIDERVPGMRRLPVEAEQVSEAPTFEDLDTDFEILSKREIVPNTHEIIIHAPAVAKKAQAGQFCIVMADERSERVPYTLADWDAEQGSITLVVLEKGQSSRKLALLEEGDHLAHLTGPLGIPLEIKNYGTVALAGGCYGIGAILPLVRAMKAAGNRVIALAEARSHYLSYYRERLAAVSDEFIQTTVDGSLGVKGHAVDVIEAKLAAGEAIDRVIAVGCPFMMKLMADATRSYAVPTWAALNPIMLDGTGMCGACRVSVGEETRFACVDGPFFDAHLVDWSEVRDRHMAYSAAEIHSLGRTDPVTLHRRPEGMGHTCSCGR